MKQEGHEVTHHNLANSNSDPKRTPHVEGERPDTGALSSQEIRRAQSPRFGVLSRYWRTNPVPAGS